MLKLMYVTFALLSSCQAEDHGIETVTFASDTFAEHVSGQPHFIMFFAPWCGHCKRLIPTWEDLGTKFNKENGMVTIGKVDCTQDTSLCSSQDVTGYPTLKFFAKGIDSGVKFRGPRDLASLEKFISEQLGTEMELSAEVETPIASMGLVELDENTFQTLASKGNAFVKFYAPWCGHCQKLAPAYESLAQSLEHDSSILIGKVDCTQYGSICSNYEVKGYPTLLFLKDAKKVEKYTGDRTLEDMKSFVVRNLEDSMEENDDHHHPEEPPKSPVAVLTGENFENAVEKGFTFVKFFAPWCGHCKRMAPTYDELGRKFVGNDLVTIAKVDCTHETSRSLCSDQQVNGFPTLLLYHAGTRSEEYNGDRSLDDMAAFITKHIGHDEL